MPNFSAIVEVVYSFTYETEADTKDLAADEAVSAAESAHEDADSWNVVAIEQID